LLKNFFLKKDLQLRYIAKIVSFIVFTAALTIAVLGFVYHIKGGDGYFYFMPNDLSQDLIRQSMLKTILPALIIAELLSVLIGIVIGFISSRKFAVPIYKIEQWAGLLTAGKYGAQITFREKDEFVTLTRECNNLSNSLKERFSSIEAQIGVIENSTSDASTKVKLADVRKNLST